MCAAGTRLPRSVCDAKPFSTCSHVVTAEGAQKLVFCAGQVATNADGNVLPPDDFDAQGQDGDRVRPG